MAAHSILAWEIPRTEEPCGLQRMGLQSWTRLWDWAGTESGFIIQVNLPILLNTLGEADIVKNQARGAVTASCLGHGGKQKQAQVERRGRFPLSVVNSHGSVKIRENTQPTDFRMTTVMQFIISFSE